MKMTIRVMSVACVVGCATLLSTPALAHGGQDHAAMDAFAARGHGSHRRQPGL